VRIRFSTGPAALAPHRTKHGTPRIVRHPGGLYAIYSGTSFSSPLVAGAAALYISTHPGASPASVKAALLAAAEPGPITGDPDTYPEGIVNVSSF
jgi:subtilisin family serine protease